MDGNQAEEGWIIRRPKRMKLTAEESLRRADEFINNPERREQFIASIQAGKGKTTEEQTTMESAVIDKEEIEEPTATEVERSDSEWIIRRPKRVKLTAEESLKRMQAFRAERMEDFIASIKKSKG